MRSLTAKLIVSCVSLVVVGLILTGVSNAKIDPKTCVGVWLFDEGKGDIAKDSSGNGNNGTLEKSPKWVQGEFDKALEFSGTSYVKVPKSESLKLSDTDFTIVVWAKSYTANVWKPFVNKYQAGGTDTMVLGAIRDTNNITLAFYNDDLNVAYTPKLNTWEHYAFTFDSKAKKREIFVNGNSVGSDTAGGLPAGSDDQDIEIGSMIYANLYYSGIIDDVAIFSAVLTQDDIGNIMNNGIGKATGLTPVSPKGLLATVWGEIRKNAR
ncbi:MAG: hypothetical protein QG641_2081 [Candidatus Poribacteria bacterium]|nr:hypothetical protein [Candidatus Poribacteria bacterium]